MMRLLPVGLGLGVASVLLAVAYVSVRAIRHPATRPARYDARRRRAGERLVVCAGDSITHGAVSFDYVAALADTLGPRGYQFVNAGINGDLAFNLDARLAESIACDPDFVTVLIGTNDVCGITNPLMARGQRLVKGTSGAPTFDAYEAHLRSIVRRLRTETRAAIALVTLPLLGDDLDAPIHRELARACEVIRRVADEESVALIELTRALEAAHGEKDPTPRMAFRLGLREAWWSARAPLLRYLGGYDYDRIADGIGLVFTTDLIHLNERSGRVLAGLVEVFLNDAEDHVAARRTPDAERAPAS